MVCLGGIGGNTPVHRAGDPGFNLCSGKNFSVKFSNIRPKCLKNKFLIFFSLNINEKTYTDIGFKIRLFLFNQSKIYKESKLQNGLSNFNMFM